MKAKFPMDVYKPAIERIQFWPSFSTIALLVFSFPCSSVGMHAIWVPTQEHGNQANFYFPISSFKFQAVNGYDTLNRFHIFGGMVVVLILYRTEAEKRQHSSAIDMLARDLGIAKDSIRPFYENELGALQEHARIRTFLSILVSRRIKKKLTGG